MTNSEMAQIMKRLTRVLVKQEVREIRKSVAEIAVSSLILEGRKSESDQFPSMPIEAAQQTQSDRSEEQNANRGSDTQVKEEKQLQLTTQPDQETNLVQEEIRSCGFICTLCFVAKPIDQRERNGKQKSTSVKSVQTIGLSIIVRNLEMMEQLIYVLVEEEFEEQTNKHKPYIRSEAETSNI